MRTIGLLVPGYLPDPLQPRSERVDPIKRGPDDAEFILVSSGAGVPLLTTAAIIGSLQWQRCAPCLNDFVQRDWKVADPFSRGVEDGVGNGGGDAGDPDFADSA